MTATPSAGAFEGREHLLPIRVYYEDTDFTGVVYHASYLKFFERGRTEFLRGAGVEHRALLESPDPAVFAVTRLSLHYRAPAKVDDALIVRTRLSNSRGIRMLAHQRLFRDAELLCEAEVEIVCIRPDGRPRRAPDLMRERLEPFVGNTTP
ncbi:MAG TPA: tol-pal system-associated acyl-CoA thioesterase [Caulobacteraceae bacterium]|nr:tol-pal system-associated acyl-CoA thioesterase [Caulobacteraceae bacterium]